jgi:hypothetical protein
MSALVLLVLTFVATTPTARSDQQHAGAAAARIRPGAMVRIEIAGGERIEGRLRSVTTDSMLIVGSTGERWLALARIDMLHERGRATRTGAIAGAVAGGVAGAGVVTLVCAIGRADDGVIGNEGQWADCAAVGGALGGAGGAAIGAGIGALIPKWHLRFSKRSGRFSRAETGGR